MKKVGSVWYHFMFFMPNFSGIRTYWSWVWWITGSKADLDFVKKVDAECWIFVLGFLTISHLFCHIQAVSLFLQLSLLSYIGLQSLQVWWIDLCCLFLDFNFGGFKFEGGECSPPFLAAYVKRYQQSQMSRDCVYLKKLNLNSI